MTPPPRIGRTTVLAVVATLAALLAPCASAAGEAVSPASPASPASAPAPLVAFAAASDAACRQLVPPLLARPDFEPVLQARPVEVAEVCRCVHDRLQGDPRLAGPFTGSPDAVDGRMRQPSLHGYLSVRVVSAALACTSVAMERSLDATPLPP